MTSIGKKGVVEKGLRKFYVLVQAKSGARGGEGGRKEAIVR